MQMRRYGSAGPKVVVIHGGPGAIGTMAPVARALSDRFMVIETLHRGETVAEQLEELRPHVGADTALVGSSWGAMLGLAYAAQAPVRRLVLVGCGTFNEKTRAMLRRTRAERMGEVTVTSHADYGELVFPHETVDPVTSDLEVIESADGTRAWEDMLRLQADGTYPAAFRGIDAPILLVHGDYDPHPGQAIYEHLRAYLPHMRYVELADCGHYPWIERHARHTFYSLLRAELAGPG